MNLIPSERSVLNMIRALFMESYSRTFKVVVLRSRWPVAHVPAYETGYYRLIARRLIAVSTDKQTFGITNAGMKTLCIREALAAKSPRTMRSSAMRG